VTLYTNNREGLPKSLYTPSNSVLFVGCVCYLLITLSYEISFHVLENSVWIPPAEERKSKKHCLYYLSKEGDIMTMVPTIRDAIAIVTLILLSSFNVCVGFMTQKQEGRVYSSSKPMATKVRQSKDSEDVFLNIDGTLASSTRQRSYMAVSVALKVWPSLQFTIHELGMSSESFDYANDKDLNDDIDESCEWLIQKLSALASITQQGNTPDAMLGCDAVMLSRLLIEEQLLDGRSNGRGGKYGSKFHPSGDISPGSKVGSRPLTVGELYTNWGEVKDILRMRYPYIEDIDGKIRKKDPLPEIRSQLEAYQIGMNLPPWQSLAYDVLFDFSGSNAQLRQNTMLLLGHEAHLPIALQHLAMLGYYLDVESDLVGIPDITRALCEGHCNDPIMKVAVTTSDKPNERLGQGQLLVIVPDKQSDETHSDMIGRIVTDIHKKDANVTRNIFVTHSSIEVLKALKPYLADDTPRLFQGLSKCTLPNSSTSVTLALPSWTDNVHPTQQNEAEMDPWLNLISEQQLVELISAKILVA